MDKEQEIYNKGVQAGYDLACQRILKSFGLIQEQKKEEEVLNKPNG
jgi:hypothetical protein